MSYYLKSYLAQLVFVHQNIETVQSRFSNNMTFHTPFCIQKIRIINIIYC